MGNEYLCHLTFTLYKFTLKNFIFFEMVSDTMMSTSIFFRYIPIRGYMVDIYDNNVLTLLINLYINCYTLTASLRLLRWTATRAPLASSLMLEVVCLLEYSISFTSMLEVIEFGVMPNLPAY